MNIISKIKEILIEIYLFIDEKLPPYLSFKKLLVLIAVFTFLITAFVIVKNTLFKKKKDIEVKDVAQVRVKKVKKENFSDLYSVMGTIRGTIENDLRFEIEGTLLRYNFNEGAKINRGEIICSIDPKDALAKASYARSKYNSEKSVYYSAVQRLKVYTDLFDMGAISETKLKEAQFETDAAKQRMEAALSELRLSQSNLEKTNLVAPKNGILAEKFVYEGEFVTPHDVVAKFISGGGVNFEVDIPEKDVEQLKIGMKVKIQCDAYPDKDFWGKIKEIAPTVKEKTRTTVVKVEIPNEDGQLRSGMFGRGDVYIVEMEDTINVPQDSIISLGNETKLIPLVKPDPTRPNRGIVELRHVKLGVSVKKSVIINEGLNPGELVVIETQSQLSDGLPVQYSEVTEQEN